MSRNIISPHRSTCDPEVVAKGRLVAMLPCMPAKLCNIWLNELREANPELRIDWYYVSGRNIIRTLNDVDMVIKICLASSERLYALWPDYPLESIRQWFGGGSEDTSSLG